jgi:hypothetical protein
MVDREKVLSVLGRRFPGASVEQIAAAANAIVGLDDEWEEVMTQPQDDTGYHLAVQCGDTCYVAQGAEAAARFRLFRQRQSAGANG